MNIKGYTLTRTLNMGLSVLMWIVYDQYQCFTGYWDSQASSPPTNTSHLQFPPQTSADPI